MIRFRDPVRMIEFATRSRSRIVRSFVRSVEFPVNRMVNETNERNEPVRFVRESVRLSATVNSTELGGVIRESFVRSA